MKKQNAANAKPLPGTHSLLEIDGSQLASILAANREHLVRNNMLEDGNTKEQAETAIDILLMIPRILGKVKLDVGSRGGHPQAALRVDLSFENE